jgi:nicotinamide-nucleotide amidase
VGDELLLGETVDTNGSWLARELSLLGFRVVRRWVVGDDPEAIRLAVRGALDLAEVVLVTGGLGPTPDDLTREAVAALLGVPLALDPDLLERLKARFRTRGYLDLPEGSQAMAQVPRGGTVLPNPRGAAPGLAMEDPKGNLCILLPGVPREMKGLFGQGVDPLLKGRFRSRLVPAVHRVIHTFGVPESVLAEEVQELLPDRLDAVTLAYLPDLLGVRLRLTARGQPGAGPVAAASQAETNLQEVEDLLEPVLSRYRYEADSGDLAEAVGTALIRHGETLAVAESCTGGLISKRMTDLPGSSRYFHGGVVAYANEVKTGFLGVDGGLIERDGVVSESVAKAMAVGVAQKLNTSVGIGVTGIAGPGGGSAEKPVGTVFLAVSVGGETVARREVLLGDREAVRGRAAHAALGLLLRILKERGP